MDHKDYGYETLIKIILGLFSLLKSGVTKKFVVSDPDPDNYKYALDIRKFPAGKEVEPFKKLEKILEQLKKAGMDTKQIPKPEEKKPAEAAKKPEAEAKKTEAKANGGGGGGGNAELQKNIQACRSG